MKKFIIVLMSIVVIGNISCKCKDNEKKRFLSGVASMGAYVEKGSPIQIRPASIDGEPQELLIGIIGDNGEYTVEIPPEIPPEKEPLLSKILKAKVPEEGTGCIIRVLSESAGSWIYSYSPNSSGDMRANVNPYTDRMMIQFYATANNETYPWLTNWDKVIGSTFAMGMFSDGITPLNVPTEETITIVMNVMSNVLQKTYGLANIQNALIDAWELNKGLDELINSLGLPRLNEFLQYEFEYLFQTPDLITSGKAVQSEVAYPVNVEIWTKYGDTGAVRMYLRGASYVMNKESDSVAGANHFTGASNTGLQLMTGESISITFDNYDCYGSLMIRRQ